MTSPQPTATAARDGRGVSSDAYGFVGVATPVISVPLQRLNRWRTRHWPTARHSRRADRVLIMRARTASTGKIQR